MRDYAKHFLMSEKDVIDYVVDVVGYFDSKEGLIAEELSDGNINYVHRILQPETGRSIILKQADTTPRTASRPLDVHRNRIEREILKIQNLYAPEFVPAVYHEDDRMALLCMEDISAYKNMRGQLAASKIFPDFADQITTFMARTLLPTTDLVLSRKEKKEKVRLFTNIDLCDITEDLVFTEPYYDYKKRNAVTQSNQAFIQAQLYENEALKGQVGLLMNEFMNNAQAALHGDLHSGSIFINETGIKVIDPEFAFYGPMGYDIGNVIGNLFFSLANKRITGEKDEAYMAWIRSAIADVYDLSFEKFHETFEKIVAFPLYNEEFKTKYLAHVFASAVGYAGTEMIRRAVGEVKVAEVESVTDPAQRASMERLLVQTGSALIMEREAVACGKDLVEIYNRFDLQV
jgi:5-methylthioribose kinase